MAIGAMFKLGEQKIRPGVFVRWYNDGGYKRYSRPLGVGAAVIKSNWGPLGKLVTIDPTIEVKEKLGTGKGPSLVNEIFEGGASFVHCVRAGTGGTHATLDLLAGVAEGTVGLRTKYPTSREFNVTIREALDPLLKELLVFENNRQIESITFEKGEEEVAGLVEAINKNSKFLVATSVATGEVAVVLNTALTGGTDPDTVAEDYTDAMKLLEVKFFDSVTIDSEDPVLHSALHAFVRRKIREGYRMTMVVGEKPDVEFDTRKQHAKAFNDFAVVYVGNGVQTATTELVGALAAGRVMGMLISGSYKSSLTKNTITGATGLIGEMTAGEYNEAVQSGMMTFSLNPDGIPQIDYGINTLVSLAEEEDEGWQKLRRVRTRYELIDRITVMISKAMANNVDNSHDGRQFVITLANGVIDEMVREGGLESGAMIIDPVTAPQGDSAWFKFDNLVDLDGLEKAYLAFGFKY